MVYRRKETMCGIVGASSPNKINPFDVKILMLYAEERGGDACGYADANGIVKQLKTAYEFVPELTTDSSWFIGHTRKTSVGGKTLDNAHPIEIKTPTPLIGVHNGTIYNTRNLALTKSIKLNHQDSDTKLLYQLISRDGLEKTLPDLEGSAALVWRENDLIYLYRHVSPLFIGKLDDGLYWGSQPNYLNAIGCTEIISMPEHTLFIVKDGDMVQKEIAVKPKTYKTHSYYDNWYNYSDNNYFFYEAKHIMDKTFSAYMRENDVPKNAMYCYLGTNDRLFTWRDKNSKKINVHKISTIANKITSIERYVFISDVAAKSRFVQLKDLSI